MCCVRSCVPALVIDGFILSLLLGANIFLWQSCFSKGCCQAWKNTEARIATLEFDRDRKSMGVIVNSGSGKKSLLIKVHSLCPVTYLDFSSPLSC